MEDPVPPPAIASVVTPPTHLDESPPTPPSPLAPHGKSSAKPLQVSRMIRLALIYIGIYLGFAAVGASGYWVYWRMLG